MKNLIVHTLIIFVCISVCALVTFGPFWVIHEALDYYPRTKAALSIAWVVFLASLALAFNKHGV